jgi:uncharacterized damage-inducible protein DinB
VSIEALMETWKDVRDGLIAEVSKIPAGQFDTKLGFLQFSYSHEMYHRGQLSVYERLMNIEPALTTRFKELFAARS